MKTCAFLFSDTVGMTVEEFVDIENNVKRCITEGGRSAVLALEKIIDLYATDDANKKAFSSGYVIGKILERNDTAIRMRFSGDNK